MKFAYLLTSLSGCLVTGCSQAEPEEVVAHSSLSDSSVAIGEEFQPCADCPTFVRVPDAPDSLRPIRFVAKYELTWNNYLAAVDEGACPLPDPSKHPFVKYREGEIAKNLEWFRIDWPITSWGPADVECYIDWISRKTDLEIAIPSYQEWQWFARSGQPDRKYPWGDDPDVGQGALKGMDLDGIERKPWSGQRQAYHVHRYIPSAKVGQFAPSPWGIHDLMGNAYELTSDVMPIPDGASPYGATSSVNLGGSAIHSPNWSVLGLNAARKVAVVNGQYSSHAALRLTLIEG